MTPISSQAIIVRVRKQDILDELSAARADLMDALRGLSSEDMLVTGVVGLWSVKDTLAHLVAWESEVVTALNHVQNRRIPAILHIEDIDEWNAEQYHINVRRPLEAILDDLESVHRMLQHMIADFDERALTDNLQYEWMEGEPLAFLIEENVLLHEHEHADEIRGWRAARA